jgi:cyclopropane fatty-acyl-phospholipid synthase-like methyltransferase
VVIEEISPNDAMCEGGLDRYAELGISAVRAIKLALDIAGADSPKSILDFPSGHGRVLRYLKAEWPQAQLSASDLDPDAVDFCARVLGATPIQSHEDPAQVELAEYDLIWCGSLLTHLDAPRWPGFLSLFDEALTPSGMLVFTTHGRRVVENMSHGPLYLPEELQQKVIADYESGGFGYREYPDQKNYGISLSASGWTLPLLGGRVYLYSEALWGSHDVIATGKPRNS